MKNVRFLIGLIACLIGAAGAAFAQAPHAAPVNPDATPEARQLLEQIDAISGRFTLTGQHNFPNHLSRWSDRVYDLTGKFPAVFGQDFGFSGGSDKDSVEGRPSMIAEAIRQYRSGAVIALTWHELRPTDDEPVTFRDSVQGRLTDFEWNELLTPGTDLNRRWVEQVDVIAGYLRQLQAAHVPVLFRPYHEINGNWFWWGARSGEHGSAALYRQIYDRFVHVHHLNNLIWVWNVNSPGGNASPVADYFPGAQYCDVLSMDIYGEFKQDYYDEMVQLAGSKPIALAEVGTMPTLDVLARQPRWAYFMMWSGMEGANSPEQFEAIFHAPNLLNRGDAPLAPHEAPAKQAVEPVTPDAIAGVKAALEKLYAAEGSRVLSGQLNLAPNLEAATQNVLQTTGRTPAIYGAELDTANGVDAARSLLDEAQRQSAAKSLVSLRWLPPNPAAIVTAGHDTRPAALTDFEWQELMTPGSHLNERWCAQVDAAAAALKQLENKGVAVMFAAYPEPNGKQYWWAGRPGIHGSAALYRMLFDRMVNRDQVRNLLWVWETAPVGFGPGGNGAYGDYFPGLLYVDALELEAGAAQSGFPGNPSLSDFAVGKVIGLEIDGPAPDPAFFARQTNWAWFLLAPQPDAPANAAAAGRALQALYSDPRVATR
jgi:mannan endo-1,4-beta-mannosidase